MGPGFAIASEVGSGHALDRPGVARLHRRGDDHPAILNTYVKDNLIDLDRRASFKGDGIESQQSTSSTSYTDLTTIGPQVSIEIGQGSGRGGEAMVNLYAALSNNVANNATFMSFAISGATTRGPADHSSLAFTSPANFAGARFGASFHVFGLNPGVHTFTAKYRVSGGTGQIDNRRIMVVPFGS